MSNAVLPNIADQGQLNSAELQGIIKELGADRLCPNCNLLMTGDASWCQACGYYRSLGTVVTATAERNSSANTEEVYTRDWIHCAVGTSVLVLLVIITSLVGRFVTDAYTADRFWFSVVQIGVGAIMALTAHVTAWIKGLINTEELKALDLLVNPIDIWRVTIEELPKSWRRLALGASGLLAVILGFTVVEGVTISHLTGKRAVPEKPRVLNALVNQATRAGRARAQTQPQAQTLEEAIEQFADTGEELTGDFEAFGEQAEPEGYNPWGEDAAGTEEDNEDSEDEPAEEVQPAARPDVKVKCVIVGYTVDDAGGLSELIVAAMHRGRLTWSANVSDGVSQRVPEGLIDELAALIRPRPSVSCPIGDRQVTWVRPQITCHIKCVGVRTSGELVGAVFDGR